MPYKIRLKARKREIIRELNTLHLSKTTKANGNVSMLSCDEISKVAIQMPTSIIQQRYESELKVNKKVETDFSPIFIQDESSKGILIGHAQLKGEGYPILDAIGAKLKVDMPALGDEQTSNIETVHQFFFWVIQQGVHKQSDAELLDQECDCD